MQSELRDANGLRVPEAELSAARVSVVFRCEPKRLVWIQPRQRGRNLRGGSEVRERWALLSKAESPVFVTAFGAAGQLNAFFVGAFLIDMMSTTVA